MTSEDLKRLLANPLYYVNGNVLDADKYLDEKVLD